MPHHTFYIGDVRDVLRTIPDESVNCVVTSPPYWGLRDYGIPGQIGLERTLQEYVSTMVDVFREVRRVLRADGTCWVNLGDSYASAWACARRNVVGNGSMPGGREDRPNRVTGGLKEKDLVGIPWRVAFALQDDGWWLRSDIIWSKPNPMPESVTDRPTRAHEYLFLLTKSERYWYDAEAIREKATDVGRVNGRGGRDEDPAARPPGSYPRKLARLDWTMRGRNKRDVWTIPSEPFPQAHFAVMPTALVRPCIMAGCPALTCPMCGAPWVRRTHKERVGPTWNQRGQKQRASEQLGHNSHTGHERYATRYEMRVVTDGLSQTCDCPNNDGSGLGVVLDPFGGSGTVSLVAKHLVRSSVYIDANAKYAEMAVRHCNFEQGDLYNSEHTFTVRGRERGAG